MKKTLKQLSFFLFTAAFLLCSQNVFSQEGKLITLKVNKKTIEQVVDELKSRYNISIVLSTDEVDMKKVISVDLKNQPLLVVMNEIFKGQNVSLDIHGNRVQIGKKSTPLVRKVGSSSQTTTISGKIIDVTGTPIIGAAVVVKGTASGVTSGVDGEFSLQIPESKPTGHISITYIGMQPKDMAIVRQDMGVIVLQEDTKLVEEVVVVGYGTRQRSTLTGSVVSVKGSEVAKSPAVNVASSLAGRLPGVVINSRSGEPGNDNPSILIRGRGTTGNSDPLYIIDGVERLGLGQLNPNDIENISVLKDSEAAIYGARAANGVIIVTTKRGVQGKPIVSLSYNQGLSQPTRNPQMADSYTYASVANELAILNHKDPSSDPVLKYTPEEIEKFRTGSDPNYANTDWYKFIVRDLTPQHRTNVSVSGASDRVAYYLSLGEMGQKGQYKQGSLDYKHYNVRSNVDVNVTDNFKIGMNLAGRSEKRHAPLKSNYELNSHIYLYWPTQQPYWPGTDKMQPLRDSENIMNWVTDNAGWQEQNVKSFQGTLFFKWDLPWIKGVSIEGSGSHDASQIARKTFATPTNVYYKDAETGELKEGRSGVSVEKPSLTDRTELYATTFLMAKINYKRSFGKHNIDFMAGYEQKQGTNSALQAARSDFSSASLPELNVGSVVKDKQSNEGYSGNEARQNVFSRINYDYASKYMAQVTFRADGSSKFKEGERFGYFPSVSAGWRLSEEDFMKDISFINNLKLRGSWGMMGNDLTSAFQYLMTYDYGSNYVIGSSDVQGLYETRVPNPNITWETSKTWNVGVESTLWNGLLSVEFEYFRSVRSDILRKRNLTVPSYTGLALPDENIAKVLNRGFELVLTHQKSINEFRYSITANVAFARNKVLYIDEAPAAASYQLETGRPMGTPVLYRAIGIFKDQAHLDSYPHLSESGVGDIVFEDVDKNGILDAKDRVRMDQTNIPEVTFGLNLGLQYKGFDMSILLQGQENAQQFLGNGFLGAMSDSFGNYPAWRARDRWIPGADNTNAKMPRPYDAWSNINTGDNTMWLFDSGFLRLKNVEFGYNLSSKVCQKIGLGSVRFSVSASNLCLLYDSMKDLGFDPETDNYWYYPTQRTFNFGINLTF